MLRYKTKTRPGLVTLYNIRPGNGAGLFLKPRSLHEAYRQYLWHLLINGWPGWVGLNGRLHSELPGYTVRWFTSLKPVTHPTTQRAMLTATSLTEVNALRLGQTANSHWTTHCKQHRILQTNWWTMTINSSLCSVEQNLKAHEQNSFMLLRWLWNKIHLISVTWSTYVHIHLSEKLSNVTLDIKLNNTVVIVTNFPSLLLYCWLK